MPELPNGMIVVLDRLALWSLVVAAIFGFVMFALPIIPLLFRRVGGARDMFVYNLGALLVGWLVFAVIGFMGLTAGDQVEIAQENLRSKDPCQRKNLPKFEQKYWEFGNGRFTVWRRSEEGDVCWLVDEKWRRGRNGRPWEDRVLLENLVQWKEIDGGLHLLSATGTRYVLVYATGEVFEYPDAQYCPQSSQSDEVFESLERKSKNVGRSRNGKR